MSIGTISFNNCGVEDDAGIKLAENLPCLELNKGKNYNSILKEIHLDLDSFLFGLSELSRVAGRPLEVSRRLMLLKKCVEDTIGKVEKL